MLEGLQNEKNSAGFLHAAAPLRIGRTYRLGGSSLDGAFLREEMRRGDPVEAEAAGMLEHQEVDPKENMVVIYH